MSGIEIARIVITRSLDEDGDDVIEVDAGRPDDGQIAIVEALGLLEFAKAYLTAHMVRSAPEDE